jgi:N-acetylglucosamine-6-sulfatase
LRRTRYRRRRLLAVLVLACLFIGIGTLAAAFFKAEGSPPTTAQTTPIKPNLVFILADDMRKDDLKYMPKTQTLLGAAGMKFENAFVSYGLCCPSRATILTGQYAHNNGVWTNRNLPNTTDGGWEGFKARGHEQDNLAVRLDDAGYSTGLLGKYFNHYQGTAVPPHWDRWFANFTFEYFDYDVNDNGTIKHFGTGKRDYLTDVLKRQTQQFIGGSVARGRPFFAYVAPIAPHGPQTPAPRDQHTFDGLKAPRLSSFNEEDVGDKPPWIGSQPVLDDAQITRIDAQYEGRAETLQALDDLVAGVVNKLKNAGALENTYIVFTSDNGWHSGEHRIPSEKAQPYEESIHMPLLVRGPGVEAGSTANSLALNTDFLPTFTDLAGATTPEDVDGRSLRPLLEGSTPATWRTAFLLERGIHPYAGLSQDAERLYGIRTSDGRKYVEYSGGFRELYNLKTDPYELLNSYDATSPPVDLATRLEALKGCAGATCRAAEDGP